MLFGVSPDALSHTRFPCGGLTKPEIRALAAEAGLRVADKPDSQEICFVPDNDYAAFVKRHRGEQQTAGEFVDPAGTVIGRHPGYERFTVGQRKGLGVAFGEPRFVLRIEPETRRVVLGTRDDLQCDGLTADSDELADRPAEPRRAAAVLRPDPLPAPGRRVRGAGGRGRVRGAVRRAAGGRRPRAGVRAVFRGGPAGPRARRRVDSRRAESRRRTGRTR